MGEDSSDQRTITVDDLPAPPGDGGRTFLLFHRGGVEVGRLAPEGSPAQQTVVVGRAPPVDLLVDDPGLSRQHARLGIEQGQIWIEDLGSKNGTHVDGVRIQRAAVQPGDNVRLGPVGLLLLPAQGAAPQRLPDHDALMEQLEQAVVRARLYRQTLALVLVRALDPSRSPIGRWFLPVRQLCKPGDVLALYDRATLELLVRETSAEQADRRARRLVQIGLDLGAPLCCGLALFPDAAASAEDLVGACRAALARTEMTQPVCRAPSSGSADEDDESPLVLGQAMREVYDTVERIALSTLPVLIVGETGTGKELVARAIHRAGPRRDRPLRCINCGAISPQLVESALFGHERGAFTGADRQQVGLFEEADGGAVLLDEVGELSPQTQVSLLRVLEDGRFRRVGSAGEEVAVDVRIIAATNRDLEAMCDEGGFREDLLFRLNAVTLELPPLRRRPDEIAPLARHFLALARARAQTSVTTVAPEALAMLERYPWPGNIRELRNMIERATVMARTDTITADDLSERVRASAGPAGDRDVVEDFRLRIQRYEAELILEALRASGWNQSEAARRLHMPLRTMVRKIQSYGLKERR